MSNPGSPGVSAGASENKGKSDNVACTSTENEGTGGNGGNGNREQQSSVAARLDPVVRLDQLDVSGDGQVGQVQGTKKKPGAASTTTGILLSKAGKGANVGVGSSLEDLKVKMETPDKPSFSVSTGFAVPTGEKDCPIMPTTPSIVKPRRPSVHFAVDSETKVKTISSGSADRTRQDGGSSRKHRSRKEKLVCRSESPSDLGMEASEGRKSSGAATTISQSGVHATQAGVGGTSASVTIESGNGKVAHGSMMNPPATMPPPRNQSTIANSKLKSRIKRVTTSGSNRARKNSPGSSNSMSGFREPLVKKKKVIEIVSPRKRKTDHSEIVKTSSDPIFIRAANKPFKFKTKTSHNRFKFSRLSFNKTSSHHHKGTNQQARRSSSTNAPQGAGASSNKQRSLVNSPVKKETETEPPCFPPALFGDLLWVLEDAAREFSPERAKNKSDTVEASSSSSSILSPHKFGVPPSLDTVAGPSSAARRLNFGGRRRVESEPPGAVGFEMSSTPGSPSASQAFYPPQPGKEAYFSPSPSYAATGPSGRRRYSRRRHARIHPPFDDNNCLFQGHHCPNAKLPASQYCEKHLDSGPSSTYSHCKYMKDGRQCGNLFPNFDATMTFCEQHAYQIAKAEFDHRNPKAQPDAARNILMKIDKILNEGFSKLEVDHLDTSPTSADILQIIEEPDIIQDLPLGNLTGGLLEEIDVEGERNVNPDKPDYEALKNAGYFTTEEIIQIHVNKLRKLKALYHREKELEWLIRQHKLRFYKDGLEKLKHCGPRFTTNPYLISRNIDLPKEYIDHQLQQYEAAKAILQTAYKAEGERGLLRLKMLQKAQDLARMAKASGQKQHDTVDICDSETEVDSDSGESRDRASSSRYSGIKSIKCAYNEGYAIRACQSPPVCWSNYCFKHILSDPRQVQWVACNRRVGPDPQDVCKTPCLKILQKHGCPVHAPLVMSKHKPLRRSEEELNLLVESDNEEEEVTLEGESQVLANLVSDECISGSHLDEMISRVNAKGPLEVTDTSDSEETDEECGGGGGSLMPQEDDDEAALSDQIPA